MRQPFFVVLRRTNLDLFAAAEWQHQKEGNLKSKSNDSSLQCHALTIPSGISNFLSYSMGTRGGGEPPPRFLRTRE